MTNEEKKQVLDCIDEADGIIYIGLSRAGVSQNAYYKERRNDADFAGKVEEIKMRVKMQHDEREEDDLDATEKALDKLVDEGNFAAIKFKLETKGRKRGWTKRDPQPSPQVIALPAENIKALLQQKEAELTETLKLANKYTSELKHQISVTAGIAVRRERLLVEVLSGDTISMEQQRDGTWKETISPKARELKVLEESETLGYRALGLNLLSKERKAEPNAFEDFLNDLKGDDDEVTRNDDEVTRNDGE